MENSNIYDDLIESYLDNSLSVAEQESFEEKLKTDPVLAIEYAERIKIQELWVKAAQRDQLKKYVKKLFDDVIEEDKEVSRTRILNYVLIAATIILVIGVSSVFFFHGNPNGVNQEFANTGKTTDDNTEKFTPSQQNEIPNAGTLDTAKSEPSNKNLFFPADGTTCHVSDTIRFSWPVEVKPEKLVISNNDGKKVMEVQLTNVTEYKLAPSSLKQGSYKWSLLPDTTTYHFSIK